VAISIKQYAAHRDNREFLKTLGMIMSDFEEVKLVLYEMLEELDDRLAKITEDVKHTDEPVEKDFSEQATQNENNEVQDFLGNSAKSEIAMIKQALTRIDNGDYGVCQVCGEPINIERLKVIPYSNMCVKCASLASH
jgi:RNA polymerase-binding protein DksA